MNKLKSIGLGLATAGGLTNDQIMLCISILITLLGMIQDYLRERNQ